VQTGPGWRGRLRHEPLAGLVRLLVADLRELGRREAAIAREEGQDVLGRAGRAVGLLVGAMLLGLLCLALFTAFLVLLLAQVMPGWLAALVVLVVYAAVAGLLALIARGTLRSIPPPFTRTRAAVMEDLEWIKTHRGEGSASPTPPPSTSPPSSSGSSPPPTSSSTAST
jgi:Putative Actinobacterial Holin-X, holin superfamily III